MKRTDVLAPLGLAVMAAKAGLAEKLPGLPGYYWIAGAALVLLHLVLRWDDVARAAGPRQLRHGGNTAVLILFVLGILGVGNYIVYSNTKRWDLTRNKRFSLSDQTKKVLAELKDDVQLVYFQNFLAPGSLQQAKDRIREYQILSPHLKADFVDARQEPLKARKYEVTAIPTLVLVRGDKQEKISSDNEQDITNALIKVTRAGKKTVCFAEGEGERNPDEGGETGYSSVKGLLEKQNYATKKVRLVGLEKVPADCKVLVVAGPKKDPAPVVIDLIRAYVKGGGHAFVMIEPDYEKDSYPNLAGLLKEWNLEAGKGVVIDLYGRLARLNEVAPIGHATGYHEIVRDLTGTYYEAFYLARPLKAGTGTVAGVVAQDLISTTPQAELEGQVVTWSQADLKADGKLSFDPKKDVKGPLTLAAVATIKPQPSPSPVAPPSPAAGASPAPSPSPSPEPEKKEPEGRVVAVGDSDFATNSFLNNAPGNMDFFMNSVAWLSEDADLIAIRPRDAEDQRMRLTSFQRRNVWLLGLVVLPGASIVAGIVVWWRRR